MQVTTLKATSPTIGGRSAEDRDATMVSVYLGSTQRPFISTTGHVKHCHPMYATKTAMASREQIFDFEGRAVGFCSMLSIVADSHWGSRVRHQNKTAIVKTASAGIAQGSAKAFSRVAMALDCSTPRKVVHLQRPRIPPGQSVARPEATKSVRNRKNFIYPYV
jgi:hypothetical protein